MKKFLKSFLFFFITLFFLEIVYKYVCFGVLFDSGLIYMSLFSCVYSLFMTVIALFLPKKIAFPTALLIYILTTIIFIAEFMFYNIYDLTFSIYSITMADQALDFTDIIFRVMGEQWLVILLFLMPLISYILLHKSILGQKRVKYMPKYIGATIILYLITLCTLTIDGNSSYSPYNLYFKVHTPSMMINTFGLVTEFRLDITRFLIGFESEVLIDDIEVESESDINLEVVEEKVEYNTLNYNFDFETNNSKVSQINKYLNSKDSSEKNEYTGMFKGKNLIYILAEGFNSIAVDSEVTPTLYKLVNEGFVFNNYYSPVFMSTTGGEFQFSTGMIPTQQSLNKWKQGNTSLPYALGNVFNNLGYETSAYHDWTYTYYRRNKTMTTLGYSSYTGCRNGLEKKMNCKIWPPSDLEMMEATVDDYIDNEHFMIHYITVSGHAEYNFGGNNMARKNKNLVKDLPYSTEIKAYLATQIELDKSLEYLLNRLEEKGILDDTVIVLSGDHYPYTLTPEQISEKSTEKRDATFEVNRSNLIIYNSEMTEPVIVDKLSCSIDIIPTVLNLFGVDYESKLLIGRDIMSEHDGLVVFADNSWISEKGRYKASRRQFTPNDGVEVESDYVSKINKEVLNRVNVSTNIVESNYYKIFFENQN